MGWNTTVVLLNDALHHIKQDKGFGEKLADGVSRLFVGTKHVDVSAGGFISAASIIETHHADGIVPVLVGNNQGLKLDVVLHAEKDHELELLRVLAEKHGFLLRRKATKR
jgi:hypothetical protein